MENLYDRFTHIVDQSPFPNWGEVRELLEEVEPSVTYWGERVIVPLPTSEIRSGSVSLTRLSLSVYEAARACFFADALTESQRLEGLDVSAKISQFYRQTDAEFDRAGFITSVAGYLRERLPAFQAAVHINHHRTDTFFAGYTYHDLLATYGTTTVAPVIERFSLERTPTDAPEFDEQDIVQAYDRLLDATSDPFEDTTFPIYVVNRRAIEAKAATSSGLTQSDVARVLEAAQQDT